MTENKFLETYLEKFIELIEFQKKNIEKLLMVKNILVQQNQNNKKAIIFGNGGSAAIASHFSVDLTKNAKIKCTNYNESDLITCFSNDYGYENWMSKSVEFYGEEGDVLFLVSSSGESLNILNAANAARRKKFSKIITFSGHNKNNSLAKIGDINFWVDSKAYNLIENVHQFLLLSVIDLIIGKSEYPPN